MRFCENRLIAKIVLVVCVLISIFGFGGGGLRSERAEILLVFEEGTDASLSSRHSMDAYLDQASESASVLSQEAGIYLDESDIPARVSEEAQSMKSEEDLSERSRIYSALKEDVELLHTALRAENLTDEQLTNAQIAYYDFKGAVNKIDNDAYSSLAEAFNRKISRFPANFLAKLFGITKVETFEA